MTDKRPNVDDTEGLTRRGFGRTAGAAVVGLAGVGGVGLLGTGTQPALALEGTALFAAGGVHIATTDGTITSVEFGDPEGLEEDELDDGSDRLSLSWSGFTDLPTSVVFDLAFRGLDDGDEDGWDGGSVAETTWATLRSGSLRVAETNGSGSYTWEEVFGAHATDLIDHDEIRLGDFESEQDGSERTRELEVKLTASVDPGGDAGPLTRSETDTADITVFNGSSPEIVADPQTTTADGDEATLTIDIGDDDDRLLVVGTGHEDYDDGYIDSITLDGEAVFEKIGDQGGGDDGDDDPRATAWHLVAPPVGTHDIEVEFGDDGGYGVAATVYSGVDQEEPISNVATAGGDGVPSATVESRDLAVVQDVVAHIETQEPDDPQEELWNLAWDNGDGTAGSSYREGEDGTVPMGWDGADDEWAQIAFNVNPA